MLQKHDWHKQKRKNKLRSSKKVGTSKISPNEAILKYQY
jgi:hypothetical protein